MLQGPRGNLGRKNKRILLLTTHQRLVYIDIARTPWELKGEIPFKRILSVSHKLENFVLTTSGSHCMSVIYPSAQILCVVVALF